MYWRGRYFSPVGWAGAVIITALFAAAGFTLLGIMFALALLAWTHDLNWW